MIRKACLTARCPVIDTDLHQFQTNNFVSVVIKDGIIPSELKTGGGMKMHDALPIIIIIIIIIKNSICSSGRTLLPFRSALQRCIFK